MDTMEEPGKIVASTAIKIVKKKKTKRGKVSGAQKMRNRFANQYPNLLDDQESYLCFLKLYHANKAAANTVA